MKQIKAALKYPFAKWRLFYWYLVAPFSLGMLLVLGGIISGLSGEAEQLGYAVMNFGIILSLIGLIPAIAFLGYELDFMGNILKGKDKQLPKFRNFKGLLKRGFFVACFLAIVSILSNLAEQLQLIEYAGVPLYVIFSIVIGVFSPILLMQYVEKEKFKNFFKIKRAWNILKNNFSAFIAMLLRMICVTLALLIASIPIITLIVTIPAMQFSSRYLIAQWYRKAKKSKL